MALKRKEKNRKAAAEAAKAVFNYAKEAWRKGKLAQTVTWPMNWGKKTRPRPDENYAVVWQIAKGFILRRKVARKLVVCLLSIIQGAEN